MLPGAHVAIHFILYARCIAYRLQCKITLQVTITALLTEGPLLLSCTDILLSGAGGALDAAFLSTDALIVQLLRASGVRAAEAKNCGLVTAGPLQARLM